MAMWRRRFLWSDITVLCSGDGGGGKMIDRVTEGEVRSETGEKGPFHQLDDGFACIRSCGT